MPDLRYGSLLPVLLILFCHQRVASSMTSSSYWYEQDDNGTNGDPLAVPLATRRLQGEGEEEYITFAPKEGDVRGSKQFDLGALEVPGSPAANAIIDAAAGEIAPATEAPQQEQGQEEIPSRPQNPRPGAGPQPDGAQTTYQGAGEVEHPADAAQEAEPVPVPAPTGTFAPTLPLELLDLPRTVDIVQCYKHLQVVDADRNNLLSEDEYVKFVQKIVSHDYANTNTLRNLPEDERNHLWGNRLSDLPPGVQFNYNNLNQGGEIEIVGYKPNSGADHGQDPLLIQELFLIKVCVNTEVAIHQVLKQYETQGGNIDTTTQAKSIPEVNVVTVYSSVSLSNKVGIQADNLLQENPTKSSNRKALDLAYQALVTQIVSEKTGMALTNPALTGTTAAATTKSGREATRRTRRLTVAIDPHLPELNRIDNVPCPGEPPNVTPSLLTEWCQIAYGQFMLYLVGEDEVDVYKDYSKAVQDATEQGRLQQLLDQIDPLAEITVTGAGPTILPPPPTPVPTHAPHAVPTSGPHTMALQPASSPSSSEPHEDNLGLIFALAAVLMTINCCIIGVSVYLCVKNRNEPKIPAFDDDDPNMEGFNDGYYNNLRKSRKKMKKQKQRSGRGVRFANNDFDPSESPSVSHAPTLEEIHAANTAAPAPAPLSDAQHREQILRGGQASSFRSTASSSVASSAAPSMDEIEGKVHRGGSPSLPSVYEEEESLPVNAGEMA